MITEDYKTDKKYRVIISGGGTGGHFYPAVAIAERLMRELGDDLEVLFVGAEGKMEMEKVPALGYNIVGLPIAGLQRRLTVKNLTLPFKVIKSYLKARSIVRHFRPHIGIGFGGYATLPILKQVHSYGAPIMIWEGNSYPGIANKMLKNNADKIFVPYASLGQYFDKDKMVIAGNPLRGALSASVDKRNEGYDYFNLDRTKPTLMITGGSLGTSVLNNAILEYLDQLTSVNRINLIWQCGGAHRDTVMKQVEGRLPNNFWVSPFIDRMDLAYNVADLVVARSGASTLSEIALIGKASILVPSSHVPDDHQRKNAMEYVKVGAAEMITDENAKTDIIPMALEILLDSKRIESLSTKVKEFAQPHSADIIVAEIIKSLFKNIGI